MTALHGPDVLADPLVRELLAARLVGVLATLDADDRKALHGLLLRLAEANDPRCAFKPESVAVVSKPKPV